MKTMFSQYEPVIGLEIHVELLTQTKLFCGCSTRFGAPPNSQACPVCLGLPGSLPVLNKKAVELLLRTALALECTIPPRSKFDRKNYFYPDMPKNYQISQYDLPLSINGSLWVGEGELRRPIAIKRIHLEEDTGKSIHVGSAYLPTSATTTKEIVVEIASASTPYEEAVPVRAPAESRNDTAIIGGRISNASYTLLDYNRAGVPLMEIVTEPDIKTPEEAKEFLNNLKLILEYIDVSNCKMEEGSLRCDANVSLREKGAIELGVKTEIKNMNSFRSVERALQYEIKRQMELLLQNKKIVQETRAWDEKKEITFSLRSKEEAHDYRYFPEPDLLPLDISKEWLNEIKISLPELPENKKARFMTQYSLSAEDANILCASKAMANFFEETVKEYVGVDKPDKEKAKIAANWLKGDVNKQLNEAKLLPGQIPFSPADLVQLFALVDNGSINGKIAKEVLADMFSFKKSPSLIIKEKGLLQIADEGTLRKIVELVLLEPASIKSIEEYKAGKEKALGFIVGQIMKKSNGKANPVIVNKILKELLAATDVHVKGG